MSFSTPYLKRIAVARAIAHPSDDLTKISKQVLNMTQRNEWLRPEPHPTEKAGVYRPSDCVIAAVVLRLWEAGFQSSNIFESTVLRLRLWYVTDEFPEWKHGDPDPVSEVDPTRPLSPAAHILKNFCETGAGWTLRVDHRRHRITGEFRSVATLWRDANGDISPLGNGSPCLPDEVPQSAHVIVLDEILAQVASATIYKKRAH